MIDAPLYIHFLFSLFATIGFAIFLNSPKSILIHSGIIGGIGWALYVFLIENSFSPISANFIAAALVSMFSEILARKLKHPAISFVIPGIIPLVPGLSLYNTMLFLVQNNYDSAISTGATTLFVSGAIALGVLVVSSLFRTLTILKYNSDTKKDAN